MRSARHVRSASARGVLRSSPGLAVLLVLDSSSDALSVAALARALGMPAPVAQQWLGTLTSLGLVRVDRDLAMWAITPTGRRVLDEHLGGFVASA
jgi:DNA-binding IclR family transcriptional regulator